MSARHEVATRNEEAACTCVRPDECKVDRVVIGLPRCAAGDEQRRARGQGARAAGSRRAHGASQTHFSLKTRFTHASRD